MQILLKVAWRKSSFKILKNSSLQILINTDRAGIIICEFSTENLTMLPDESVRATAFLLDSSQEFPSFAFSQERHCSQMNKKTRLPCPSVHCSVVDCFLWILLLVVTSGRSAFSFVLRGLLLGIFSIKIESRPRMCPARTRRIIRSLRRGSETKKKYEEKDNFLRW